MGYYHKPANAVRFTKKFEVRKESSLAGVRLIRTLSALWGGGVQSSRTPWIDGGLIVPSQENLYYVSRGDIASETGYRLFGIINTQIVGAVSQKDARRRVSPDILALCGEHKWPEFVEFEEVGYGDSSAFSVGLSLAATLISRGYVGSLHCYSDCIDDEKYSNHERCFIHVRKDGAVSTNIRWGDESLVGTLLDLCRAERFVEEDGWEEWERPRQQAV